VAPLVQPKPPATRWRGYASTSSRPAFRRPRPTISTSAPGCAAGKGCITNADCDNLKCDTAQKKCLPASNTDGVKNLDETGIDCGGPTAAVARCAPGQGCAATTDCNNVLCNVGTRVCDPPTSTDGLKNGTETDIDCGGGAPTMAPGCPDDQKCTVDKDCSSAFCAGLGRWVAGRSCKATVGAATAGLVTCGKRETADGTKVHESCCRSLPLPVTTTVRLDKYEVTSGRMRQFVESVGPNLRAWAKTASSGKPERRISWFATPSSPPSPSSATRQHMHARTARPLRRAPSMAAEISSPAAPVLRARGITKVYRMGEVDVIALRGVDFDLFPRELVALLGASGSGKSTLLNILGGLDVPTSGDVGYADHDLAREDDAVLTAYRREHVGFVFQFYNLIPSLTARENVALVTDIADDPLDPAEALALVGLGDRLDHFPSQLSGGEQQRVAIARAVSKRPDILLCDEPTGALDFQTGRLVLEVIERVNHELGTATAIITHNAPIARMADRIVTLSGGLIVRTERNVERVPSSELVW